MSIRYVSPDEYEKIVRRNNQAIELRKRAKSKNLTLDEKLALLRQAKALEALNDG